MARDIIHEIGSLPGKVLWRGRSELANSLRIFFLKSNVSTALIELKFYRSGKDLPVATLSSTDITQITSVYTAPSVGVPEKTETLVRLTPAQSTAVGDNGYFTFEITQPGQLAYCVLEGNTAFKKVRNV